MGPKITGMLVDALLAPERDFVVRRRLPRVLAYLPSTRSVEGLFAALEDQRFEVRFYAGRALFVFVMLVGMTWIWVAEIATFSLQNPGAAPGAREMAALFKRVVE